MSTSSSTLVQVCNGTGSYFWLSFAVLKKKKEKEMTQCFREPAVFTPGFSQRGQFLALRFWRLAERRFETSLAVFLSAPAGLLRTVCSLKAGTHSFHVFWFWFLLKVLSVVPWANSLQGLEYDCISSVLPCYRIMCAPGKRSPDHWAVTTWELNSSKWKCIWSIFS